MASLAGVKGSCIPSSAYSQFVFAATCENTSVCTLARSDPSCHRNHHVGEERIGSGVLKHALEVHLVEA